MWIQIHHGGEILRKFTKGWESSIQYEKVEFNPDQFNSKQIDV